MGSAGPFRLPERAEKRYIRLATSGAGTSACGTRSYLSRASRGPLVLFEQRFLTF